MEFETFRQNIPEKQTQPLPETNTVMNMTILN